MPGVAGIGIGIGATLGRDSSPSTDAIHHLQLLREARPPSISTYDAPTAAFPAKGRILPMTLETRPDAYIFVVELPGYNPEVRWDRLSTLPRCTDRLFLVWGVIGYHRVVQEGERRQRRRGHLAPTSGMYVSPHHH